MENKGLRNTIVGSIITIMVAFVASWIQVNNRISILEVQVDNIQKLQRDYDDNLKEVRSILLDIQIKVSHLQDTKAEK